ncbi:MAG: cyclic nucleotide-binding domain-containing protein [Elusimicrobiota bacterium]
MDNHITLTPDEVRMLYRSLRQIDFFADLTMPEIDCVIAEIKREQFKSGKTIVKQGQKGDCFYLISKGAVSVWLNTGLFRKKHIAQLKDGQYFGEMALLDDQTRKATVIAETDCEFYVLYRDRFWDTLMKNPSIDEKIRNISKNRSKDNAKKTA